MTKKETIQFLALIKLYYPNAFNGVDEVTKRAAVNMWQKHFAAMPLPVMEMALEKYAGTSKFQPGIADITSSITDVYWAAVGDYNLHSSIGNAEEAEKALRIMQATSCARMGYIETPMIAENGTLMLTGG